MPRNSTHQRSYLIANRAASDAGDGWYHVIPVGEFPGVLELGDGEREDIVQVLDDVALNRILAGFNRARQADAEFPGLLVDFEHFSHDHDQRSEAAAWAAELELRNDDTLAPNRRGIYARLEKTALGEPVIGSAYKFFSPVFHQLERLSGNRVRPVALEDIGLTNKPVFKTLAPAMNRDGKTAGETVMIEKLRTLLGLASDAGEDAVVGKVESIKNRAGEADALTQRAETAETRVKELEGAQLAAEADKFCDDHAAVIANRDGVRKQFIANKDATIALFEGIKAPESAGKGPEKILNRKDGKTPSAAEPGAQGDEKAAAGARRIRNRAQELSREQPTRPWGECWDQAKGEVEAAG